jgi:3'-5' exoribonuclease
MDADTLGLVSDYSVDGKLLGHIVRGVVNIQLAAEKTGSSQAKALLLQHMVLSHHGIPEYGSPIAPKFPEAEVLNTLDTLDARLYEMDEAIARAVPGGFSEKVWGLDNRQLYRIPEGEVL